MNFAAFVLRSSSETHVASHSGRPLTVLITGCDHGFGKSLAHALHDAGYHVFACCLTEGGVRDVESVGSKTLRGLKLDVSSDRDVEVVCQTVERECGSDGLYCLVNNAGIQLGSFIDFTSTAQIAKIMDVNYMGTVRMCKAMLGALRRHAGCNVSKPPRIINIASAAGIFPLPLLAGYSASKHAVEAFSTILRYEIQPWGIKVAIVEPGFAATPLVQAFGDTFDAEWAKTPDHIKAQYKDGIAFVAGVKKYTKSLFSTSINPEKVVRVMEAVVTTENPKAHNLVGIESYLCSVLTVLPTFVTDFLFSQMLGAHGLIPESTSNTAVSI